MKVFLVFLFVIGILTPQGSLHAESAINGLTLSPAFQEITLGEKDTQADFSVSLSNTTETTMTFRIAVFDFGSLDESGGVAFLGTSNDLEKKYALASWIRPEKDVVTIQPGGTENVRVTIENRDTLSSGGHYGALTFKTENDKGEVDARDIVSVNQLFTTLVFVKKVGGEIYSLGLKESEYKSNLVKFQDIVRFRFQNSGNVHVVPRGMALISDPFGRTVAKGIINEESSLILPETFRVYPVRFRPLMMSFIPGRYTMEIAYRYDGKDDFSTSSIRFYFVPWPIFAIAGSIAVAGWYIHRRRNVLRKKTESN